MDFINQRRTNNNNNNNWNNTQQFSSFPNNFENKMNIPNPLYDQIIMKPPRQNVTHGRQHRRLIVDSRDRDLLLYPNPANYIYEIESEYTDVISMRLVKANIPNTSYLIDSTNNRFIFQEDIQLDEDCGCVDLDTSECKEFRIRKGDYGICNLMKEIGKKMTCISEKNGNNVIYKLIVDPIENKVVIFSDFGCAGETMPCETTVNFKLIFEECDKKNCKTYCDSVSCDSTQIRNGIASGDLQQILKLKNPFENGCGKERIGIVRTQRNQIKCRKTDYPTNSIGKKLGFDRKNLCEASGTVSKGSEDDVTSDNGCCIYYELNENKYLVGNCTKFLDEVYMNDNEEILEEDEKLLTYIKICGKVYEVDEVCSDTLLILKNDIPDMDSIINKKYISGTKKAQFKYDLSSDPYIILNIRELEVLDGKSPAIADGFAVIPFYFPHNTKNFSVNGTFGQGKEIKYFNPPEHKIKKLTIKFKTYDGVLYDFNGLNHMLEFEVETLNQVGKYNFN
jgi:hypothetical protein